ncbi:MAG TPA: TetR/AcrR family transcriptional regulator [Candidatus Dormibacteraeota bacterium]
MLIISTPIQAEATSRVQRKLATRQRLVDAAAELAGEKGFANVALMDVAERAGLTTGAVYSNFRSREELLMEVATSQLGALQGEFPEPASDWSLVDVARGAAELHDSPATRRLIALQTELYLLALRDPGFRDELRKVNDKQLATVARWLATTPAPAPLETPPPTQVATALVAMMQGLQQHRLIHEEQVPAELFAWCAQTLVRAAIKPEDK